MYFADDESSYGPVKLGFTTVNYVHQVYLEAPPESPAGGSDSALAAWKAWLRRFIGVCQQLRVVSMGGADAQLSSTTEFLYVARHIPYKFLGLMRSLSTRSGQWPGSPTLDARVV